MTTRETIIETINKLFVYTDSKKWNELQNEVFSDKVFMDMTSLDGEAKEMTSKAICDMWDEGFKSIDQVNHLGGNYLVDLISNEKAEVFAYATATHFKELAKNGKTREFVGSYDLKLELKGSNWRIYSFIYTLKYVVGNIDLS